MCGSRGPRTRNGVRNVDVHSNNEVNPVILAKAICPRCNQPRDFREMIIPAGATRACCLFCLEDQRVAAQWLDADRRPARPA
jgi:hypothetical protein